MSRKLNSSKGCRKIDKKLLDFLDKKSKFETTAEWINDLKIKNKTNWEPKDIKERTKKIADWAVTKWVR